MAPAGTKSFIVDRLARDLAQIVDDPEVVARLRALGMEPFGGTSAAFRSRIASEATRWKDVIERARIPVMNEGRQQTVDPSLVESVS